MAHSLLYKFERGYEDERFRDPNYQIAKRFDLPETKEMEDDKSWNKGSETYESVFPE